MVELSASSPQRVNLNELGPQDVPSVARLQGGGYVIAWSSAKNGDSSMPFDVCFQVYDANSARVGSNACLSAAQQRAGAPRIAPHPDGGFTIAWNEAATSDAPVWRWQEFDAGGQARSGIQGGNLPFAFTAERLAGGGYVRLLVTQGQGPSISFQLYAPDETPVGGPRPVGDGSGGFAKVVSLAGGGFAVAWLDGGASTQVMTRAFSGDGTPLGAPLAVAPNTMGPVSCGRGGGTCPPWQNLLGLMAMDDGGYIVVWLDGTGIAMVGGLYARQFRGDGSTASNVIGRLRDWRDSVAGLDNEFVMAMRDTDSSSSGISFVKVDTSALR